MPLIRSYSGILIYSRRLLQIHRKAEKSVVFLREYQVVYGADRLPILQILRAHCLDRKVENPFRWEEKVRGS